MFVHLACCCKELATTFMFALRLSVPPLLSLCYSMQHPKVVVHFCYCHETVPVPLFARQPWHPVGKPLSGASKFCFDRGAYVDSPMRTSIFTATMVHVAQAGLQFVPRFNCTTAITLVIHVQGVSFRLLKCKSLG